MIEIIKQFGIMAIDVFNKIFFIEIELTDNFTTYFGLVILAIAFFVIAIVLIFNAIGINFLGGDD